jgi:hypothetical protein
MLLGGFPIKTLLRNFIITPSIKIRRRSFIQASILEKITPEKIESASLVDLCRALYILKKAELGIKGEKVKIEGLLGYLLKLEKESNSESEM